MDGALKRAYALALAAHAASAAFALLVWSSGLGESYSNLVVATGIMASGLFGGVVLMRAAGVLAPLPFFMIGCGAYFGLGTMVGVLSPLDMQAISFSEDVQRETLARVSALNAVAALVGVAAAGPFFAWMPQGNRGEGLQAILVSLEKLFPVVLAGAFSVLLIQWLTFPASGNFLLRSALSLFQALPIFALVVAGAVWHRLTLGLQAMSVLLLILAMAYGVLGLTKLYSLFPMVLMGLGLLLGGRNKIAAIAMIVVAIVIYFGVLAEIVQLGRRHISFDPVLNTIADRMRIVWETFVELIVGIPLGEKANFLIRLTVVPFEVYFMTLYDTGSPGDTLSRAPEVLVPRVLWPDKPIFQPGAEFDLVWRGYGDVSNLAIAFVGEAYWNAGWWGVLLVSALIGAQLGWFTRKWLLFRAHGAPHLGVFLLAPMLVLTASQVEANIVGAYVAGTLRTAILIMAIDVAIRTYQGYRAANPV